MKVLITLLILVLPFYTFSQEKKEPKDEKKVSYAFIPILMYNSSLGGQVGLMASSFFNVSKKDTISPASSIGATGSYFTSNSFFGVAFSKIYLKEDNYRLKSAVGAGNINFQTYVDIPQIPNYTNNSGNGTFVDYNTKFMFVYLEGTKRIWNNLFIGLRLMYSQSNTLFDTEIELSEDISLFGFGLANEFDNRDDVFFPTKGQNVKINTFTYLESLGSTSQYSNIEFEYNKYFKTGDKTIIMARAYGVTSFGDVPFAGKNVVGKDDLRGYSNGKFRAKQVYDLQTEVRWNFYKKWGMVGFGGVAVATDDLSGTNYSGLLPAIGLGLRFKAIKSRNINIGIDVAKGVNDWGLYFRIGEAFTR